MANQSKPNVEEAQASEPSFALESLGWKAFQDLCATIVGEVLGQTLEVFSPGHDGGRDAAFQGTWKQKGSEDLTGQFAFQCKFSSQLESLAPASVKGELSKATRLGKQGLASIYILLTNLKVSGSVAETLKTQFEAIDGVNHFRVYGREWITQKLRESPALRMLVPRIYGLGDLSQILDARGKAQAEAILSALGEDISKLVVTRAYRQAARAIATQGYVLVLGEPAAGKSTIGAGLAVGSLDQWGCQTHKVLDADDFVAHWNPEDPKRFFWIDDAFGTTQYQPELAHRWNAAWLHLSTAIRKGARVLMTSRDYIYRSARSDLKSTSFPLLNESQVVVKVQDLSRGERDQILYNHIRLGAQPKAFKTRIKPFLPDVANNERFLPEIARRLGTPLFTRGLSLDRGALRDFVEKPIAFLLDVVASLDRASQAALALVFMRGGTLESPVEIAPNEEKALDLLGVSSAAARNALASLDGSLLILTKASDRSLWRFKHPTVGDAYATLVAEHPELIDIYLQWTNPERLMEEITCGNVSLAGVKVIVPEPRFPLIVSRLRGLNADGRVITFLATRCSAKFLKLALSEFPELATPVCEPSSLLPSSPAVRLLVTLSSRNLLPEDWRRRFVNHAKVLIVEGPDLGALVQGGLRAILTADEIEELRTVARHSLLPVLPSLVSEWSATCDDNTDPEEWLSPLQEVIDALSTEFDGDEAVARLLGDASSEIESAVENIRETRPPEPDLDYDYDDHEPPSSGSPRDSIFDDVDS